MADMTDEPTLELGFVRGLAPAKWGRRWADFSRQPLEMTPLSNLDAPPDRDAYDVVLERAAPESRPPGTEGPTRSRHAVLLYEEAVALVLAADHEDPGLLDRETLELIPLLDYPGAYPQWPAPQPWAEPSLRPRNTRGALELVATGLGGILLPLPLARHLVDKRRHAVLPLNFELPGTTVWATWNLTRDAPDIQQLIGVMRGRTPRSSRG